MSKTYYLRKGQQWQITSVSFYGQVYLSQYIEKFLVTIYSSKANEIGLPVGQQGLLSFTFFQYAQVPGDLLYLLEGIGDDGEITDNPNFTFPIPLTVDEGRYWISCVAVTTSPNVNYGNWYIHVNVVTTHRIWYVRNGSLIEQPLAIRDDKYVFSRPGSQERKY